MQPHTTFLDIPTPTGKTSKIAVYEWGDVANAETIFCVHGLTRNGRDFDILAENLSANYRLIAVDMAGRGKSEWQADPALYNYPQYVMDVANILAQLGLQRIHFIGTSMGGIIGMLLVNAFPNLLKTLTINDIGCFVPAAGLKRISQYVGASEFASRLEAENALRLRCETYGISSEEHWQNLFESSIQQTPEGKFRLAYDPAISKNFSADAEIKDIDLWQLWEAVKKVPTLLIHGKISDILPADVAQKMQATHPNFTLLEIPKVGHAPALADNVQISTIRNFISRHK